MAPQTLERCSVDDLLFDTANPRLPEHLLESTSPVENAEAAQLRIDAYFLSHGVLAELVSSFVDNGFFQTEPMIAVAEEPPADKTKTPAQTPAEKKRFVVLEGNRRLAALRLVRNGDTAGKLGIDVPAGRRDELMKVPVLIVANRSDADAMIGFRHIGGLKFWEPEAKARWIRAQVDNAAATTADPSGHVARMVGLPKSQVRYYYFAAAVMKVARDEKFETRHLAEERFGVLVRAVENTHVRKYIAQEKMTDHVDLMSAVRVAGEKVNEVLEVLNDIAVPDSVGRYAIGDSRNIPKYGEVLANPETRKVMREEGFEAAVQALAPISLGELVKRTIRQTKKLRERLDETSTLDQSVVSDLLMLKQVVNSLRVS
jgi:hypothetical protein